MEPALLPFLTSFASRLGLRPVDHSHLLSLLVQTCWLP